MIRTIVFAALAATLGAATAAAAAPSAKIADVPASHVVPPPYPAGTVHTVVGVLTDGGDATVSVAVGGFVLINQPVKFKCANANGCTVLASASVQAHATTSGGNWQITPLVDGGTFTGSDGYQGPLTGAYTTGTYTGYITVAQGAHTIQTNVYIQNGGEVGYYGDIYTITTP